ncbi:hypothetical protein [Salinispora vitiensis]|uniref:hypothetical protein n=1 Tax=Salinispora vitiensis TaxID=999544 RepID=UPI00036B8F6F|nr:hypothetical protein [Salinispora vitiensis]
MSADFEFDYDKADDNGISVAHIGSAALIVGTWGPDAVAGTVRDLATRMSDLVACGNDDWRPLKVYVQYEAGTLKQADLIVYRDDDWLIVVVYDAESSRHVASARFIPHRRPLVTVKKYFVMAHMRRD